MDDAYRRQYLHALGVAIWEPRRRPVKHEETASDDRTMPNPVPNAVPVCVSDPTWEGGAVSREIAATVSLDVTPDVRAPLARSDDAEAQAPDIDLDAHPERALAVPEASSTDESRRESAAAPPDARQTAVATLDWVSLGAAVVACRTCGLCETRTQTVFGVGKRDADLLLIGEAPGAEEDRQGEPFVGRAGQLLNAMLAAIGLSREQVYIANALKCRPPGNRDPKPEEMRACEGYLLRQTELIRPRVILTLGRISAQSLLCTEEPVGRLRGRWHAFGETKIPLRATYHPAYLLRSPDQKAKAWEDLLEVRRRMDKIFSV